MVRERRQARRTPSNLPLDLYDIKGRMIVGEGRFRNLSLTGGLIETKKPLPRRSRIRLELNPTGKARLHLTGQVVWSRKKRPGFTYGVRFQATPRAARKKR
jgi:hypothetical protein